jgi:hypothetical protein
MVVIHQMAEARLPGRKVRHGVVPRFKLSANVGRKNWIVLQKGNLDRWIGRKRVGGHGLYEFQDQRLGTGCKSRCAVVVVRSAGTIFYKSIPRII